MEITQIVSEHKDYFNQNQTKSYEFRVEQLEKLYQAIQTYSPQIIDALYQDLHKSEVESYSSEIGYVLGNIRETKKKLKKWMKPQKAKNPIFLFGSKSYILSEPYGVMLIIGPFNYPFQLVIEPLIGAIAAGNTVIIKPSELTPTVSRVVKKMVEDTFESNYIKVVEGAVEVTTELLAQPMDYIFFTGSPRIGKVVMKAAAENLTPVTLELGGKSPAIVTKQSDLNQTAKTIVWGKYLNAGQTCVAPDYVLVDENVKDEFLSLLIHHIKEFYGEKPQDSPDYGRMATKNYASRMNSLLKKTTGTLALGGEVEEETKYVAPTIVDQVKWDDALMSEEIFGPLLPILTYESDLFTEQVIEPIKSREKPLALYLFTEEEQIKEKVLSELSFGGGVVNDTILHLTNSSLPFGGVGQSGIGNYHGKDSFIQFTHQKSIVEKSKWIKLDMLYPPYTTKSLNLIKKFMK
ncbi:aldehyde dehydrogenase [Jeotgalibaca sp. MA1X17-3]|uniref:aldehyde dehydrogenase n=1 Tax=Jeotgalibaca sp. MA1X17-3 TaxID=2908211 RepID=UPI001F370530|nr:aldehyde dehydrogenase [Jeotgalibaca sp. MA1X17-3]UJF16612.1 aldehyde dehydrogenase [Jeotgalibaca sp. MA1X17-3]